ncbi:MAG: NitT/TauT family transport system ATP-binding protein [Solirubrobacteraceae bacterium]
MASLVLPSTGGSELNELETMATVTERPPIAPPILEVRGLTKSYGEGASSITAIDNVDLSVIDGEFLVIVGPSGCGKTTFLKCVAGLMPATAGHATLRGTAITGPPEEMAVVFQDYSRSLMPWLTVRKNVMLPLRGQRSKKEAAQLAAESLDAIGLGEFGDQYPWQLSGGMQQRVAIARALACKPKVLLMDEPFASVDAQTRAELEDLVLDVRRTFGVTVVLVTHDIDEAVYMGDRVLVLSARPSRVKRVLDVDLPQPRDQLTTKSLPEFAELRGEVYQDIRAESRGIALAATEDR